MADRVAGLPTFIADAFAEPPLTRQPGRGLPPCRVAGDTLLLAIADEMNLSETAFIGGGRGEYQIR